MVDIAWKIVALLAFGCVGAGIASVALAVAGRWTKTRALAKLTVAGAPLVALAAGGLAFGTVATLEAPDEATRATILALGLSQTLSCSIVALCGAIVGAPMWIVASRKIRVMATASS